VGAGPPGKLDQPGFEVQAMSLVEVAAALRIWPQQHVDTGALCFRPDEKLRQLGAGHYEADAAPVALLHDAHAFRHPRGHEQAQGEGLGWGHGES
jgi:hypothetical protein